MAMTILASAVALASCSHVGPRTADAPPTAAPAPGPQIEEPVTLVLQDSFENLRIVRASPDDRSLIYVFAEADQHHVWLMDFDGPRHLATFDQIERAEFLDANQLVVVEPVGVSSALWQVPLDGSGPHLIADTATVEDNVASYRDASGTRQQIELLAALSEQPAPSSPLPDIPYQSTLRVTRSKD